MHEITYLWYGGTTFYDPFSLVNVVFAIDYLVAILRVTYTDPFSSSPSQIVDNKEIGKEELAYSLYEMPVL